MKKIKKFYTIEPEGFIKMDLEVRITEDGYHCLFKDLKVINHYNVADFYVIIKNGIENFDYNIHINNSINSNNQNNLKPILNDEIVSKIWNCIKEKIDNPDYLIEI